MSNALRVKHWLCLHLIMILLLSSRYVSSLSNYMDMCFLFKESFKLKFLLVDLKYYHFYYDPYSVCVVIDLFCVSKFLFVNWHL